MKKIGAIFMLGVGILLGALLLNIGANMLGVTRWYEFIRESQPADSISYIWLFLLYPLLLGVIAYSLGVILKVWER